jgi:mxaA protein
MLLLLSRFFFAFFSLMATVAHAQEVDVTVRPARTFGYFVGDLIRAEVEVLAPENMDLSPASLPHPGPLGVSLVLREVAVRETKKDDRRAWVIGLVYQSFYVALDVRKIEIPGFELRVGGAPVSVSGWTVSVTPLREIVPGPIENARDYLRPDGVPVFADEAIIGNIALGAVILAVASLLLVASDRGWPPFHRRRARVFNILARDLTKSTGGANAKSFREALRSVHRAIDATNGASLLAEDLPAFLARHPQFASLRPGLERFFETSRRIFFGGSAASPAHDDFPQLLQFVIALARCERAA